jgi:hypothetical protein
MTKTIEINDNLLDDVGNHYLVLDKRYSKNRNTHTGITPMEIQVSDIGRKVIRWVQEKTANDMLQEGKLIVV